MSPISAITSYGYIAPIRAIEPVVAQQRQPVSFLKPLDSVAHIQTAEQKREAVEKRRQFENNVQDLIQRPVL